jgi:formate dehydrogenase iron-sulfur subunit
MPVTCLVDTTRCIGCRSCQIACKEAHDLKPEKTRFFAAAGGYQNPKSYSPQTRTFIAFHEIEDGGTLRWVFIKRQCMHCTDMRCLSVCPPLVFSRTKDGLVVADAVKCIGCYACVDECPFAVPAVDTADGDQPRVYQCTFCIERQQAVLEEIRIDGRALGGTALAKHQASFRTPACIKACPSGALTFGDRDKLLAEARRRIAAAPKKYVDHIYGEKEMQGTSWLYLAAVPFKRLGFPTEFRAPAESRGMG